MKGNVCGHYIAIRPDLPEEKTQGGIILATEYDDNQRDRALAASITGTIISIGPDAWKAFKSDKPWAKVGDRVHYIRHVSKIIDDPDELDKYGKPTKIFVIVDENVTWNLDAESEDE